MTTGDLLKQLKALPRHKRDKVIQALLAYDEVEPRRLRKKTKRVVWPDVEARAKRIFGTRVLPNLVLLEREEEAS
jgi:hypothetical protein